MPGLFDAERGVATFLPNLPGDWEKVQLTARVADALGAPAALINDARAFALAESALGAARGCDTAVFVAVGTGVGGGITVGGRLHEGRAGRAGEIGHLTIAEKGPPCTCGNRGCLEAFVREALGARRLRRAGQLLGIGVANAIVLLAPDRVVIGGGVGSVGEKLLGAAAAGGRAARLRLGAGRDRAGGARRARRRDRRGATRRRPRLGRPSGP